MLTTVEGIFKDGRIELREDPPAVEQARVIVTFLLEKAASEVRSPASASEANLRMLDLLRSWRDEPLAKEDEQVLDGFDEFQRRHPLRLAHRLSEEPDPGAPGEPDRGRPVLR